MAWTLCSPHRYPFVGDEDRKRVLAFAKRFNDPHDLPDRVVEALQLEQLTVVQVTSAVQAELQTAGLTSDHRVLVAQILTQRTRRPPIR